MSAITIGFGVALLFLGFIGYFGSGGVSITALIPAAFGFVFLLLGYLARNHKRRAAAMHVAVVAALIGLLGSMRGLTGLAQIIVGGEVARPAAVVAQSAMAILMAVFIGLSIQSFVAARRQRT